MKETPMKTVHDECLCVWKKTHPKALPVRVIDHEGCPRHGADLATIIQCELERIKETTQ